MSAISMPPQWPKQVALHYTPERILGKGGFGCVYMAAAKSAPSNQVAIKVVKDDGYAEREIAILSELMKYSHPNIVKIFGSYAPQDGDDPYSCMRCLVLALARGPPLNYILKQRGALGLMMAQKIASQLVNTVAFLHGHGVIHRDIQPSNIIVSGSKIDDNLWWSDELDDDGILARYVDSCNITLIDFGFARALCADDLAQDNEPIEKTAPRQVLGEVSANAPRGRSRTRETIDELDESHSHRKVRDLSALGTRNYVAPEVLSRLKKAANNLLNISAHSKAYTSKLDGSNSNCHKHQRRSSLSTSVSDYGMDADAFSVGATIRFMVTGVPPEFDVDDYIQSKSHPLKKAIRMIKRGSTKSSKRYKCGEDIPGDVMDLIEGLTHYDSLKRITIRSATGHPWVSEVQPQSADDDELSPINHGGPIEYLECAKTIP